MKTKEVKVESKTVKSQLIPQALIGKNGIRHEITKVLFCARSENGEFEGLRYAVSFNGAEDVSLSHRSSLVCTGGLT